MTYENLHVTVENKVAKLVIDNPPANALNSSVILEIGKALEDLKNNPEVKVIVLTGAGKMFIAGADIKEISTIEDAKGGQRLSEIGQKVFSEIEHYSKPVIAAINGACLGGGMELAMSCHIRIASQAAKFGQPEVNLGLIPGFAGTQRLARLTNVAIAAELILTGDLISAEEAHRLGIVNKVVPAEQVVDAAMEMAAKMASKGAISLQYSLETIFKGIQVSFEEGQQLEAKLFGEIFETADKHEGVAAFIEKRAAQFTDK